MTTAVTTYVPNVSADSAARLREMLDWVSASGDYTEIHNEVIPAIQQAGFPLVFHEQIVLVVERKLKELGAPLARGTLRNLCFPPFVPRDDFGELPEWARPYCFVTDGNRFYNTRNGNSMDMIGFQAMYGENMPIDHGRRANAAERCLHFWKMPKVERLAYRPDQPQVFEWDGVRYANLYSPSSVPVPVTTFTPAGVAGIDAFQRHLYDMCGRRDDVFRALLFWMAHNVQRPGVKIRWSPILKGINGDGKTLCAAVLRAAMGYRNVSTTSNSNIANSGGFTDWALRAAVNVIEEIMLTGKQRHALYNAMKEFVTNNIVDINVKGGRPRQEWNCTNHWANTNHNDALPLEASDRRWFVVFTPWASLADMRKFCGLDEAAWKARTDAIDHAKNHCAGELRAWFLQLVIPPDFDVNGSAPMTPEKRRMMASGKDDVESVIDGIVTDGAPGVGVDVISTAHLTNELRRRALAEGFDVPQSSALSHMLTRLGYSRVDKQVKWRGVPLRVWVRNGVELTNEEIRSQLDHLLPNLLPGDFHAK